MKTDPSLPMPPDINDTTFHYRVGGRADGRRPGAHAGRTGGTGNAFLAHARLFDHPDPRRLDLRASLRAGTNEWLVRTYRQRAAVTLLAVVDVSASMAYGSPRKLDVAADFVASMGDSAYQTGDTAGLLAFDSATREDLYQPPRHSRVIGQAMAAQLRAAAPARAPGCGVQAALQPLAGREALVFLVSDFHWPLKQVAAALDLLVRAWVVPLVLWDEQEMQPPALPHFVRLRDAESGALRSLWLTPRLRRQWQEQLAERRRQLDVLFAKRQLHPLYLTGHYDPIQLSQYFLEGAR